MYELDREFSRFVKIEHGLPLLMEDFSHIFGQFFRRQLVTRAQEMSCSAFHWIFVLRKIYFSPMTNQTRVAARGGFYIFLQFTSV